MKLISMTDFVFDKNKAEEVSRETFIECRRYAEFLKQPLELKMFVPERPEPSVDAYMQPREMTRQYDEWFEKYGKYVLFEDFDLTTNKEGEKVILGDYTCFKVSDLENRTIEDLVKYVHIKLTKSAIHRIRSAS